MGSMLSFLMKQLHWFIILKSAWGFYMEYGAHQELMLEKEQKIPVIEAKIRKQKREVDLIESFKRDLENSKRKVESVASQIEKVQKQLPNSISDPEILEVFSSEAKLINLKNVALNPKAEQDRGFYFSKTYGFKGVGTYLQFLIFFERLAKRERILNIAELVVTNSSGKQKGRFQTVDLAADLEAYKYNKDYKERSGIKDIESKFNNKKKSRRRKNRRTGKKRK